MTDLEKIQFTKSFIDKMANGINPLTGEAIPENDLLNNIRISRCMFYVSGLLQEMCFNLTSKTKNTKSKAKIPFHLSEDRLLKFAYNPQGMFIRDIVSDINALIDADNMKSLTYKQTVNWLIDKQYLYVFTMENGKNCKRPTAQGVDLGISEELRHGNHGDYYMLIYNENAQKFIVSNCNSIYNTNINSAEQSLRGQRWTLEQDNQLTTMFNDGILVDDMAQKLQRSSDGIRARLVRLGLIQDRQEAL